MNDKTKAIGEGVERLAHAHLAALMHEEGRARRRLAKAQARLRAIENERQQVEALVGQVGQALQGCGCPDAPAAIPGVKALPAGKESGS